MNFIAIFVSNREFAVKTWPTFGPILVGKVCIVVENAYVWIHLCSMLLLLLLLLSMCNVISAILVRIRPYRFIEFIQLFIVVLPIVLFVQTIETNRIWLIFNLILLNIIYTCTRCPPPLPARRSTHSCALWCWDYCSRLVVQNYWQNGTLEYQYEIRWKIEVYWCNRPGYVECLISELALVPCARFR